MVGERGIAKDVLKEILVWLPVKSLVRFRCASKYFFMFIKSSVFINSHLIKQGRGNNTLLVRRHLPPPQYYDAFSFHDLDSPELKELLPNLSIPFLWDPQKRNDETFTARSVKLLGPCNGIVCIVHEDRVILGNPVLREFRLLPRCPFSCPTGFRKIPLGRGFGSSSNNNFKVVLINELRPIHYGTDENGNSIHLYNSSNNSWREINDYGIVMPYVFSYKNSEIFFKGACHWNGRTSGETTPDVILTFNVSSETFGQFEHPSGFKLCSGLLHCLMVLNDERLASVRYEVVQCQVEIWVMKEYGIKDSWTKQFVIGPYLVVCPFFVWRNNEQLLGEHRDGRLASFGLHNNDIKSFPVYGIEWTLWACCYKESLVSIKSAK